MSIKSLSGILLKGVCFLAILMPLCAQSTTANTLQHPRDQIALQLGAIQMGYTTAGTAFQLVTGNATNAQQAANALVMGKNALDATVAKPAVKVQGAMDSPAVDTVEYRDQLYSAVEHVVTSPAAGAIRGLVTLEGGKKVAAVARIVAPPNSWTVPVPYALEARSSADAQVLSVQVVDLQTQATTLTSNLTSVQGKLSGVSSNVTTLTSNVTNLQNQAGSLSSNVTALQTQTAGLGSNLTAVQGQLSGVASNVTTLTSNVTTLHAQTSGNKIQINEIEKLMSIFLARDYDGDGVNEYRELKDGTDPNNASSFDPLSKGLVAFYPFNGNAKDESGNGNDILPNNANISFEKNRNGSLNAAIKFNNNQAYAVSKRNSGITGNQAHSYSFWVNLVKIPEWSKGEGSILQLGTFPESGAGQASQIFIDDRQGTGVRIVAQGGYADLEALNIQTNLVNSWHNITYVYSGTVSGSKIYLDGDLLNGIPWGGGNAVDELHLPDAPVQIGVGNQGSGLKSIEGSVSDVRIYNRALSAAEVSQFYVKESIGMMVPVQGGMLPPGSELAGQTVESLEIAKYETTWCEWKTVRDWAVANGYSDLGGVGQGSGDNHPVESVSWYDVVKWCNAKSEKEGLTPVYQANGATFKSGQIEPTINSAANGYRLPTDAEWEWAARGGVLSQGYTYSGSNDLDAVAWYIYNSGSTTHEIGTKASNELGIFDMSGNAWEWVFDAYDGSLRRVRGTGFGNHEDSAAVANRDGRANPDYRYYDGGRNGVGFRLARNASSMHSTDTFGTGNNTFDLEFVSIGNPMNAADPDTNLGSVSYPYRISKYTISQKNWDKAVSSGLQNASSSTDHGGVGLAGENTPTNNVSWYEAAAFVNWLNTSKGYQPAYNLTFSNGAWSMLLWSVEGSWSQGGVNRYRHKNAHYFLPSDNEWYKAAYYDPNKPGGAGYWMYPTGSDTPPEQVSNTGTGKGGAGWNYGGAGTDPGTTVYGLASWSAPADINECGGLSPYGTMGQGGNVAQWVETSSNGLNSDPQAQRRAMGYAYYFDSSHLGKTGDYETKNLSPQNDVGGTVGIRVGSKKD